MCISAQFSELKIVLRTSSERFNDEGISECSSACTCIVRLMLGLIIRAESSSVNEGDRIDWEEYAEYYPL